MSHSTFRSPWIFTAPVIAILLGHLIVDTYSSIVAPLIGVIENEFEMRSEWAAILLGVGSVVSGLSQPVFAWISDKTGSRIYGAAGIILAGLGIGLIGYSANVQMVFLMFSIGMVGVGMFHPIATARIGAIAGDQRGFALSLFFVFGMAGFFFGSLFGPNLFAYTKTLTSLWYLIFPGLFIAVFLQRTINSPTGEDTFAQAGQNHKLNEYDWLSIAMLYLSAVFRFFVNMALIYLLVRWVENHTALMNPELSKKEVATLSAPTAGTANAVMFVGQGVGGLIAGALIRHRHEKLPLILTPLLFAPFVFLIAKCNPNFYGFACCFFAGIGFAAMTPITISVGQQLMPGHTRVASGLMLGGAWIFAALGPSVAEYNLKQFGLTTAFMVTAIALTLAGISAIGVRQFVTHDSNNHSNNPNG